MRRLGNMGNYGRIWEGAFGPKEVAGDSGKLWETL